MTGRRQTDEDVLTVCFKASVKIPVDNGRAPCGMENARTEMQCCDQQPPCECANQFTQVTVSAVPCSAPSQRASETQLVLERIRNSTRLFSLGSEGGERTFLSGSGAPRSSHTDPPGNGVPPFGSEGLLLRFFSKEGEELIVRKMGTVRVLFAEQREAPGFGMPGRGWGRTRCFLGIPFPWKCGSPQTPGARNIDAHFQFHIEHF